MKKDRSQSFCTAPSPTDSQSGGRSLGNPLQAAVGQYVVDLQEQGLSSLTEQALLAWLRQQALIPTDSLVSEALYRVHFLMRNALYRWARDHPQWRWQFSVLGVSWQLAGGAVRSNQLAQADVGGQSLADYYLDMDNLQLAAGEVDALLTGFWRRFADFVAADGESLSAALALLELDQLTDLASLKRQYRRRAMALHPDRGGSDRDLQALNSAFALARAHLAALD